MKKYILFLLAAAMFTATEAKIEHLLPTPKAVTRSEGSFPLNKRIRITAEERVPLLMDFAKLCGGVTDKASAPEIAVEMVATIPGAYDYALAGYPDEAYSLKVEPSKVTIKAITTTGIIRAVQTMMQLAEGYDGKAALECVEIVDWPAFKLRGFMHDVGRSFIPMDEIRKEIELLARFKVNTFHFHMTENQAWRFEVKKYPQLTADSSMSRFPGMYYTQEQCRELEAFAAERGITIIPEIDMPGHSAAFKKAMGHSMQSDKGVQELKEILDEVAATFPLAPYIHIGADEESITYPGFLKTMTDKVHSLGKKVIVWNPIRGVRISTDAGFDMTQMWSTAGRKVAGIPNIDCRYNYVNHFDVYADVAGIYKSNIYYSERGDSETAGTITALWNDRKLPHPQDIIVQNNMYANILASCERAWKGGGTQYIEKGGTALHSHTAEYAEFADWERRFLFHKAHSLRSEQIPYVRQCNIQWTVTDAFPNGGDAGKMLPPESEGCKEHYLYEGKEYGTRVATGAGIYLRHTWGAIVPSHFDNPRTGTTAYAWTYIYSPVAQQAGAQIEFQNYGRSERDYAPDSDKWDRRGSRIWLNNNEIMPPAWENSGKPIDNEKDLLNENFTARPVTPIVLRQGWNKVFIKLPNNPDGGIRLNKWMFTFVVTDRNGRNALDNIIYVPNLPAKYRPQ
ncbi:MAG: family 20 glycosylhydrolase [Bacteroidaceae bacterium]|nr:family 20 glycosylhydrolase [Bacteroidaceae bacterium]